MIGELRGDYWDETMVSAYVNMGFCAYVDDNVFYDYVYMMCGYPI